MTLTRTNPSSSYTDPSFPILTQQTVTPHDLVKAFCRPIDIPSHRFQLPSREVAPG